MLKKERDRTSDKERENPWPTRWVSRGATGETSDHILPVRFFFGRFGILLQSVLWPWIVGETSR